MLEEFGSKEHTNDRRLAISWNQLGNAHILNNNWDEAEQCFLNSIRAMEKVEGYKPTMISLPIVNDKLSFRPSRWPRISHSKQVK